MTHFLKSDSGAVTVDWVVLTGGVVGLGLATMSVVSGGVEDISGDIDNQLSHRTIIQAAFLSPGGVDFDFASLDDVGTYNHSTTDTSIRLGNELGSISGDTALLVDVGDTPWHWNDDNYGGFSLPVDMSELEVGETFRVSYWARTDGADVNVFASNTGVGGASSLNSEQTINNEWQYYSHEAVLDVTRERLYLGARDGGSTLAFDDVKIERVGG